VRHGTLPQLAALEAVVRLGSATRAAEALCIAQPTLSGQLRKLSDALGVRLFETRGKRLVPTDAALTVLRAAHEVSGALERCEEALAVHRVGSVDAMDDAGRTQAHAARAHWSDAPIPETYSHCEDRYAATNLV
jgi:DNA-binding transcriptional LysR family regulator